MCNHDPNNRMFSGDEPIGPNQRPDSNGGPFLDYNCGDGFWVGDRDVCHYCLEERTANNEFYRESEVRTSFGVYAGRMCDECWKNSGYRDATDDDAVFDPMDAGEVMWEDEY